MPIPVEIANEQSSLDIDEERLCAAAAAIAADAGYASGELSLAVVDDPTIHELNRRHLSHDYPTDVLSFALEDEPGRLVGQVIVSADTAIANAAEYGWPAADELLLYVVHGTLHLVGHRDKADDEVAAMRDAERRYLKRFGAEPPDAEGAP
ncbi:MAG: rRNA maturation RNase YbeY [Planctomycetota bacterium]